jgi:DNA-binding transcriptional LysR family regulator
MTLQQLRCLCEVANQGLNISRAARVLHTSQPAITKMIRALESELGVQLLIRTGPKLTSLSDEGAQVIKWARRVVDDVSNLRLAASESKSASTGTVRVGTTHLQARYALVSAVQRFAAMYPDVQVVLCQGTNAEIAGWVSEGEVDIGISTLPATVPHNVVKFAAFPIHRCIITPADHPLLKLKKPSLVDLARHRLIAYDNQLATGAAVRKAFAAAGITPKITLRTADADLVKTYVRAGLGIAVIQQIAIEGGHDVGLRSVDASHLFPASQSWITVRRDVYLRRYMTDFIQIVAPQWTAAEVERVRAAGARRMGTATEQREAT